MAGTVCRMCGNSGDLLPVFDEGEQGNMNQLGYVIYLATGIRIQPTDVVSKMVCSRCCNIALKLNQYRDNAVANDKLLKERIGQPYFSPITDQEEILRISSKIIAEEKEKTEECIVILDDDPDDSVMVTSVEPCNRLSQVNEVSVQNCLDELIDNLLSDVVVQNHLTEENVTAPQSVPCNKIRVTEQLQLVLDKPRDLNKSVPNIPPYQHPSVRKIYKTFKNIVLPRTVFRSDISPVISLDSDEVNEWFNKKTQKLPSVVIKKVPNTSSYRISSSPILQRNDTLISALDTEPELSVTSNSDQKENNVPYSKPFQISDCYKRMGPKKNNNGRRPRTNRKRTLWEDNEQFEVIPEKKKRVFCNKNALQAPNKLDLPEVCPSDRKEQKAIFTSSLELQPVGQISPPKSIAREQLSLEFTKPNSQEGNLLTQHHTRIVFVCPVCNKVYDSKKGLTDHEKIHFKCKFCKITLANLQLLKKHQSEDCDARVAKTKPVYVETTFEDSVTTKIQPRAFDELNNNTPMDNLSRCDEYIDYSRIEEILIPHSSNGLFKDVEETDQNFGLLRHPEQNNQIRLVDEAPTHKIIPNPNFGTKPQESSAKNQTKPNKLSNLSETEMLRHLLKKYAYSPSGIANDSVTYLTATTAKVSDHSILTELRTSMKMYLEFKFSPTFQVTIEENDHVEEPQTIECWADKKIIYTERPRTATIPNAPNGVNGEVQILQVRQNNTSTSSTVCTERSRTAATAIPAGSLIPELQTSQVCQNSTSPSSTVYTERRRTAAIPIPPGGFNPELLTSQIGPNNTCASSIVHIEQPRTADILTPPDGLSPEVQTAKSSVIYTKRPRAATTVCPPGALNSEMQQSQVHQSNTSTSSAVYTERPRTVATPIPPGGLYPKVKRSQVSQNHTLTPFSVCPELPRTAVTTIPAGGFNPEVQTLQIRQNNTSTSSEAISAIGSVVVPHNHSSYSAAEILLALKTKTTVTSHNNQNVSKQTATTASSVREVTPSSPIKYPGRHTYSQTSPPNFASTSKSVPPPSGSRTTVIQPMIRAKEIDNLRELNFNHFIHALERRNSMSPLNQQTASNTNIISSAPSTSITNTYGVRRSTPVMPNCKQIIDRRSSVSPPNQVPTINNTNRISPASLTSTKNSYGVKRSPPTYYSQTKQPAYVDFMNGTVRPDTYQQVPRFNNGAISMAHIPINSSLPVNQDVLHRQIRNDVFRNQSNAGNVPNTAAIRVKTIDELL